MARIVELWERVHVALAPVAPGTLLSLAGPARRSELERLRKALKHSLPADLEASLRVHDGQHPIQRGNRSVPVVLFNAERLLATPEIGEQWNQRCSAARDLVGAGVYTDESVKRWWRADLIPVTDSEGNGYCVDLDGGLHYHVHDEGTRPLPGTWASLLDRLATLLENGRFKLDDGDPWVSHADLLPGRPGR